MQRREFCGLFRAWPLREKDQKPSQKGRKGEGRRTKRRVHRVIIIVPHSYAESTDARILPAILKRLRSREPQRHFIRTHERLFSFFLINAK